MHPYEQNLERASQLLELEDEVGDPLDALAWLFRSVTEGQFGAAEMAQDIVDAFERKARSD